MDRCKGCEKSCIKSPKKARSEEKVLDRASPAARVFRQADLAPIESLPVEQEEVPRNVLANADDGADRHKGSKTAYGDCERTEDALLGAGVAIVAIESVADEAAVARFLRFPAAEECNLPLELDSGCGE